MAVANNQECRIFHEYAMSAETKECLLEPPQHLDVVLLNYRGHVEE